MKEINDADHCLSLQKISNEPLLLLLKFFIVNNTLQLQLDVDTGSKYRLNGREMMLMWLSTKITSYVDVVESASCFSSHRDRKGETPLWLQCHLLSVAAGVLV